MQKLYNFSFLFLFCISISTGRLSAQNVAINNDGSLPNANAILDIKSTNRGVLIPRIDYNNRPVGPSVPGGMLIYVTANGPLGNNAYYFYDGTNWLRQKTSNDIDSLSLSHDTLTVSPGNYVVVGNILNLIGYYKCNNIYTQVATDNNNCGSCGIVCNFANATSTCTSGVCSLNCNAGYGNCDNIKSNGCEVNLNTSLFNCGACGTACGTYPNTTSSTCSGGVCGIGGCSAGFANCDNVTSNGCETYLINNPYNCGGCGIVCPTYPNTTSSTCSAGVCGIGGCSVGYANCDNVTSNGCETSLNTPNNCGGCGIACQFGPNSTPSCTAGICSLICNAGYGNCDGLPGNGCEVNLSTNHNNCGTCGHVCTNVQSCVGGVCQ